MSTIAVAQVSVLSFLPDRRLVPRLCRVPLPQPPPDALLPASPSDINILDSGEGESCCTPLHASCLGGGGFAQHLARSRMHAMFMDSGVAPGCEAIAIHADPDCACYPHLCLPRHAVMTPAWRAAAAACFQTTVDDDGTSTVQVQPQPSLLWQQMQIGVLLLGALRGAHVPCLHIRQAL